MYPTRNIQFGIIQTARDFTPTSALRRASNAEIESFDQSQDGRRRSPANWIDYACGHSDGPAKETIDPSRALFSL